MIQHCGYCGFHGPMVFVHSHYQCPVCHNNIMPCCEGEFADDPAQEEKVLLDDGGVDELPEEDYDLLDNEPDDEVPWDDEDYPLAPEDMLEEPASLKWFTPVFEDSLNMNDVELIIQESIGDDIADNTDVAPDPGIDEGQLPPEEPRPDDKGQYRLF
jgi:hypothetical protein